MAADTLFTVSGSVSGNYSVFGSGTGDGLFNEVNVTPPMIGFDATPTIGFGDDGDPSAPLHPALLGQGATFTLGGSSTNAPANPAPIGINNATVSAASTDAPAETGSAVVLNSDPGAGPSGGMGASSADPGNAPGPGAATHTLRGTSR